MPLNPIEEIVPGRDFQNLSRQEKNEREQQLIEKFSMTFRKTLLMDPVTHTVFYLLLQGADPYKVIEKLLTERQSILNDFV